MDTGCTTWAGVVMMLAGLLMMAVEEGLAMNTMRVGAEMAKEEP